MNNIEIVSGYKAEGIILDCDRVHCSELDVTISCECGEEINICTTYSCWRCSKCGKVYWVEDPVVRVGNEIISDKNDPRIFTWEKAKERMKENRKKLDELFKKRE